MKKEDIDRILADLMTGEEISKEERLFLEAWKQESGKNFHLTEEVQKLAAAGSVLKWREENSLVFKRLERKVKIRSRPRLLKWYGMVAGILLLVGMAAYFMFMPGEKAEDHLPAITAMQPGSHRAELILPCGKVVLLDSMPRGIIFSDSLNDMECNGISLVYKSRKKKGEIAEMHTIRVPRGGEYSLELSDGSKVWLNAESELTYPAVFMTGERRMKLKGEGYFEVAEDSLRPFIVESYANTVKVLGTRFNIAAYCVAEAVKTTLLQGKIKVSNGCQEKELLPGQQAVCMDHEIHVKEVDADVVISYVKGIFEFDDMLLGEITDQLERWYNVNFIYLFPELRNLTFTGAAPRYDKLDFILNMLEKLADVHFVMGEGVIQVTKK